MTLKLLGKKKGMVRVFDETGRSIPCTVILAEPNAIVQLKSKKKEGYEAIQLGAVKVSDSKKRKVKKPLVGHYARAKVEPRRYLLESRVESSSDYKNAEEVSVSYFENCKFVDVCGTSKGKGFQGVQKRWNFAGGPASHGSGFHRSGGSTGMRSTPGRCFPKVKKPGQMGSKKVTVEGLKLMQISADKNLLVVKGAIPGPSNGLVYVRKSVKKEKQETRN